MEGYYEQYLFKDNKDKIKIVKFIRYVIFTVIVVFFYRRNILGMLFGGGMLFLTCVYCNKNLVEYEYHLSNKEFSIYKIVSESKRSFIGAVDISRISAVNRVNEYTNIQNAEKCFVDQDGRFSLLMITGEFKGKQHQYIVNIDEVMLKNMKRINPGKFYFF